ncbi:hypothetical protein OYT1_ch0410 [Ferriphaselus amnicola]|uniref:Histidine kinase n=1 Tax=Ferriphaselus amnicola TaxID=1188319 RepID=A0A2Z6G9A2_9PROT|nr:FIST C-terminal domain-containing protein [Ferriphaselus amnicola]BBE49983.1 hypothetical protein OYT1_ch0410 [Ferriphaselus amnicola]
MVQPYMRYFATIDVVELAHTLDEWQSANPSVGILALFPEACRESVSVLQSLCRQRKIPLAGGIFPELIADNGFTREGVWLLRFDEMPYVALYEDLEAGRAGAIRASVEIVAGLRPQLSDSSKSATLFMLFDALVPNIATMLDEIYLQLANRVHYAGANAGSETFQPMPCLFNNERLIQNGVLVMLLTPHHGAILEHGYCVPPKNITATTTDGNRILQIDWRPAFEVYQELVRAQFGVEITRENFYQYGVHFPFGIIRANHNVVVRIPVALGDDGSLFCVGEVPAHAVLALLEAPKVDSVQTLEALTKGLADLNDGSIDEDVMLFYCAGRRLHMGVEAATTEVEEFARRTGAAQVAGALSLGEIGGSTLWGYPLFHNATLVAALW